MIGLTPSRSCGARSGCVRAGRLLLLVLGLCCVPGLSQSAWAQGTQTVPNPFYFAGVTSFYTGDYQDAEKRFKSEWRGAIRTAQSRWIDSICYHTMVGECYYQKGMLPEALDEYNNALRLYLSFHTWMLRVNFPAGINGMNPGQIRTVPWGRTTRNVPLGNFPDKFSVSQGQINNNAVVQNGGVVQNPINYPVVVQEIVRCTTVALRRRRELLGPAAPLDALSGELATAMGGAVVQPNHWAQAWSDVQFGCALSCAGKDAQAKNVLARGVLAAGQFDHPLTATALFELGRIELIQGNFDAAINLFQEASYAAFHYEDLGILEESFRYGQMAHILSNKRTLYPPLPAALAWAQKQRNTDHLAASLAILSAEGLALLGDTKGASAALQSARQSIGRTAMAAGKMGTRFQFATAQVNYQQGQVGPGDTALNAALTMQQTGSLWLWHLKLADRLFSNGSLSARDSFELFGKVLREPTSADWLSEPLESLSKLVTPHQIVFEHWFETALKRNEKLAAMDIAELMRRHRFFNSLFMGGRLMSLRWVLDAPLDQLPKEAHLERQDLLAQFPAYGAMTKEVQNLREQLLQLPPVVVDKDQLNQQTKLFEQLNLIHTKQELLLREIAVRRVPCSMVFPPKRTVESLQANLGAGQVVLCFLQTTRQMYGFSITKEALNIWELGVPTALNAKIVTLLRDMGQFERNKNLPVAQVENNNWKKSSREIFTLLAKGAPTDFPGEGVKELIIVPDGILWYLPFEVLDTSDTAFDPLITRTQIRYVPLAGLAFGDGRGRRPSPTTLVAVGKLHPQEAPDASAQAFTQLEQELAGTIGVPKKTLPGRATHFLNYFDRLVVYDDLPGYEVGPFNIMPLPSLNTGPGNDLNTWLTVPFQTPDQVILPGFHSAAETALSKLPAAGVGQELFLTSCAMMASGSRTLLLSRWRTGGKSSFDLIREFSRELDHTTATDAWQRSVLLSIENEIDFEREPRIQAPTAAPPQVKANHPFFWSGYMLVDTGVKPVPDQAAPMIDPADILRAKEKQKLLEEAKKKAAAAAQENPAPAKP